MNYIVDTYAWIEYFRGTEEGNVLAELLKEGSHKFITLECCIAELACHAFITKHDFKAMLDYVKSNSIILPILLPLWIKSARIRGTMRKSIKKFGLIDSLILAKQKELHGRRSSRAASTPSPTCLSRRC